MTFRLQQELGVCRRDSLEGLCQALQLELNRLQRQVWQKRIQRPMVAVPPTSLQQPPPTGIPKFMPQRKCNTYARYEMTKPTASNVREIKTYFSTAYIYFICMNIYTYLMIAHRRETLVTTCCRLIYTYTI